jgi:hypothetical protein
VVRLIAMQTVAVIDLREPDGALVTIGLARRRFEKGGSVPVAVRELLVELADALADGGPLDLGVSSGRWLRARETASRAVGQVGNDPSLRRLQQVHRG